MTKKSISSVMLGLVLCFFASCNDHAGEQDKTFPLSVQLVYPEGFSVKEGVRVKLENRATKTVFEANTDAAGVAAFNVIAGAYTATASDSYAATGSQWTLNGSRSDVVITSSWSAADNPISLTLEKARLSQVIIKEYYFNGCQKNDGSGAYQRDAYVVLYNNSDRPASLKNLCFGATLPTNSQATNNDYVDGVLSYSTWVPAGFGIFYFNNDVTLEPGKQVVVAINGAIDNTATYSNSVNLAKPEYYVFYDPTSGFNNAVFHPAPDVAIPESHYLKAIRFPGVTSKAYTMSVSSPAFFIFATEGTTPVDFAAQEDNLNRYNNSATQVRLKVPVEWVIDAVEVFQKDNANNKKRLVPAVDAGYIEFPDVKQGYTLYRNVDKEKTEAIADNAGKLVAATGDTADPSGIDAEASMAAGARIVYKDTNNAGTDFHVRSHSGLRN